jgi:hypothetical protein
LVSSYNVLKNKSIAAGKKVFGKSHSRVSGIVKSHN